QVSFEIEGRTPYISHRFSEKIKATLPGHPDRDTLRDPKGVRQPEAEAFQATYWLPDGEPGIPAVAFKAAMVSACRHFEGITMVEAKLKFHVLGERGKDGDELVRLTQYSRRVREDTPRLASGANDLRYRNEFSNWK